MAKTKAQKQTWQNRIVGSGVLPASEFLANPQNWRIHPKAQQNAMIGALNELGWIQEVIVNQTTGHVVDGHMRIEAASRQGDDTPVPVKFVDLTPEEEALALATLDPIAAMAAADRDKLSALMDNIHTSEEGLAAMLTELAEREGIMRGGDEAEDPGAQIDKAAELQEKWSTATGQLWLVGEHRILCGDCTKAEDVQRLMAGEKAELVWTDPPYGVNYGDKLDAANPITHRVRSIENDDLPASELETFIRSALKMAATHSGAGAAIYVACPAGTLLPTLIMAFCGSGFIFHWGLVWVKDQLVLGRGDYHFKHENILYGWKDDGPHYFINDRTQTSVFEYPRPKVSAEHPTMKPPELVSRMVNNSSKPDAIVLDPFLGSGTTIVACQKLGRRGRGIEISPAYVAVALERLAGMGLTPELAP